MSCVRMLLNARMAMPGRRCLTLSCRGASLTTESGGTYENSLHRSSDAAMTSGRIATQRVLTQC